MANRSQTIGTSADYSTIAGWEASIDRSTYDDEIGEIITNKDFGETVTINASAGGGGTIILTVNDSVVTDGTKGSGARNVYGSGDSIRILTTDVTIEKMELSGSAEGVDVQTGFDGILIDRCVIYDCANGAALRPDTGEENNISNCFCFGCTNGLYLVGADGGTIYMSYCSIFNCSNRGIRHRYNVSASIYGTGTVALGNSTDWYLEDSASWAGGDYNISGTASDSFCPGANSDKGNETASSYFTDVSTASDPDLHKASGKDGSLDGGPSTGLGTYWPGGDIDGDTRSDYDIGADEIAGGPTTHALSGTITGTASPTGDLTVSKSLSGAVSGSAIPAGNLAVTKSLAGGIAASASPTGNLTRRVSLSGSISGHANLTGDLTVIPGSTTHALSGEITGTASPSGDVVVHRAMSGAVTGTASMVGNLTDTVLASIPFSSKDVVRFKIKDPL